MLCGPALLTPWLKAFRYICVCRKVLFSPLPPSLSLMCTARDLAEHMLLSCPLCPAVMTWGQVVTLFSRVAGCLHFPAFCSEKNDEHRMVFCQQLCYKGNCVNARPQYVAKIPLCQIPYVCMRPGRPSYIL